jgi:hypothetical protein
MDKVDNGSTELMRGGNEGMLGAPGSSRGKSAGCKRHEMFHT